MGRKPKDSLARSVSENANKAGNFLERKDPKLAARVLEMLAEGESFTGIRRETGLNWDTIARLKARHEVALAERRQLLAQDALDIAEGLRLLQKEKMRMLAEDPEQLARTNIKDLGITWGIANDKYLSVIGENKVTVEHKTAAPSLEDAMKAIEEARAKLKATTLEVVAKPVEKV